MALDFFSSRRHPVAVPTEHHPARTFFDRERAPQPDVVPPDTILSDADTHTIFRVLPEIIVGGDLVLVPSNRYRVGLYINNFSDVVLQLTHNPSLGPFFDVGARVSAFQPTVFTFQPPNGVPQNAVYCRIALGFGGKIQILEILRVRGEDYAAMQAAAQGTGQVPTIGQTP